jgi:hypothetical protein
MSFGIFNELPSLLIKKLSADKIYKNNFSWSQIEVKILKTNGTLL